VLYEGTNPNNLLLSNKGSVPIADRAKFITELWNDRMVLDNAKNQARSTPFLLNPIFSGFNFSFRDNKEYVSDKIKAIEEGKFEYGSSTKTIKKANEHEESQKMTKHKKFRTKKSKHKTRKRNHKNSKTPNKSQPIKGFTEAVKGTPYF
jgi:hypothetical protein